MTEGFQVSPKGGRLAPDAEEMIRTSPALFSAHYTLPLEHLDRAEMLALAEFLKQGTNRFRWALAAAAACAGGLKTVFDLWWELEKDNQQLSEPGFYVGSEFRQSMFRLLNSLPGVPGFDSSAREQFESLKRVYDGELGSRKDVAAMKERNAAFDGVTELSAEDELVACCLIRPLEFSLAELVTALRAGLPLGRVPGRRCAIMLALSEMGEVTIEEAPELTTCIVRHFRAPRPIGAALEQLATDSCALLPEGVPPFEGMLIAVQQLVRRRLLAPTPRTD